MISSGLCVCPVTESSETSSQDTSSDSVIGLSTLTIPGQPSLVLDSYNNNEPSSFLCPSTPPSSISSPSIFEKDEDLQPQGTNFITAVSEALSFFCEMDGCWLLADMFFFLFFFYNYAAVVKTLTHISFPVQVSDRCKTNISNYTEWTK